MNSMAPLAIAASADDAEAMRTVRAQGRVNISFKARADRTVIADLAEGGGYRAKFPAGDGPCEAVIINTGGGMTGGDAFRCRLELAAGTQAVVTSQSAEKIYRSSGLESHVAVEASLGTGAGLSWLPQETILFSGARIARHFTASIAADARLLLAESWIFGRVASGETLGEGQISERWRIRRDGRLVFADDWRIGGQIGDALRRPAVLNGMCAVATILLIGPDAEAQCERVRAAMERAMERTMEPLCGAAGASAWNGMLLARAADNDPARLRRWVTAVTQEMLGHPLPRVWQC